MKILNQEKNVVCLSALELALTIPDVCCEYDDIEKMVEMPTLSGMINE